jgi:uncharacterized membrane protein SpoIIM required for sporulation
MHHYEKRASKERRSNMLTIILCTVVWLISVGLLICVVRYYDDLKENFEDDYLDVKYARGASVALFVFQLLCFLNILSAIAKW